MGCGSFAAGVIAAGLVMAGGLCGQERRLAPQTLVPRALVASLDEQIQIRFLDPRLGFGMSRLCGPMGHGALGQVTQSLRRLPQPNDPGWRNAVCGGRDWAPFRPRNRQEQWVVSEIKDANVEIWTLLVGGVRRTLEGPVVAGSDAPQGLNEVRRLLLPRIAKTPIPEEALENWQVAVRPVRASRESCLGCHADKGKAATGPPRIQGLKLQDTLGFLVYLYRQRP